MVSSRNIKLDGFPSLTAIASGKIEYVVLKFSMEPNIGQHCIFLLLYSDKPSMLRLKIMVSVFKGVQEAYS